eukprot:6188502-Pleurochrysis_carterae.AAC.4
MRRSANWNFDKSERQSLRFATGTAISSELPRSAASFAQVNQSRKLWARVSAEICLHATFMKPMLMNEPSVWTSCAVSQPCVRHGGMRGPPPAPVQRGVAPRGWPSWRHAVRAKGKR